MEKFTGKLQIVVEGSEKDIQQMIENNTKSWRLFLVEPDGVDFKFINLFWGFPWDGTHESLRELMITKPKIEGQLKHCIWVFKYNGEDRFAFCTWTKQVYDFNTKKYYQLEGNKLAYKITNLIIDILEEEYIEEFY